MCDHNIKQSCNTIIHRDHDEQTGNKQVIRVLGIAPSVMEDSIVYDGNNFRNLSALELKKHLAELKKEIIPTFIAWDSPLTAPTLSLLREEEINLSTRKIEQFFHKYASRLPKGITVSSYANTSSWTLSQYLFGYPVINHQLTKKEQEWKLIHSPKDLNFEANSKMLTESHPSLSLWLLLKEQLKNHELFQTSWEYQNLTSKDSIEKERLLTLVREFVSLPFTLDALHTLVNIKEFKSHAHLNAFVSYIVAKQYILSTPQSFTLGDSISGSFLLPQNQNVQRDFTKFLMGL